MTGAIAAAGLWLPLAVGLLLAGGSHGLALAVAGLVVSPLIGALLGPQAVASRGLGGEIALLFAVLAVAIGAFVFSFLFAIFEHLDPVEGLRFGWVALLVLGLPIAIVGTKLAIVWVLLVRWLVARQAGMFATAPVRPANDRDERINLRLVELLVPLLPVGAAALASRLLYATEGASPAIYLVPLVLAFVTGLWRPGLLGSVGAWLGWSAGVALGSLIDTGELWLSGPAIYALIVALVPHGVGSAVRVLLRPRVEPASG